MFARFKDFPYYANQILYLSKREEEYKSLKRCGFIFASFAFLP